MAGAKANIAEIGSGLDMSSPGAASESSPLGRGLSFERLEVLDPAKHDGLAVADGADFDFARATHIVPLNAVEFSAAARHYPILFNSQTDLMTVALVGLRQNENLFVEDDNRWTPGCYVPAIVRRYPFVLMQDKDKGGDNIVLCIDAGSAHITGAEFGEPLFNRGKPTDLIRRMAQFSAAFAREQGRTRDFVEACRDADVLIDRAVRMVLQDGREVELRGFQVIDEDRLKALPGKQIGIWWQRGWCALAFAHLISLGNFGRLIHKVQGSGTFGAAGGSWLD